MATNFSLKVLSEVEFDFLGRLLKMRHYNDGVWELLNEDGLPIVQGFCMEEAA
jgi:hypothetical protein